MKFNRPDPELEFLNYLPLGKGNGGYLRPEFAPAVLQIVGRLDELL